MIGFDFEIKYKLGCENRAADSLSRKMIFAAISLVHFSDLDDWWEEIQADDKLRTVTRDLLMNLNAHLGYQLQGNKLLYKGRLVLLKNSTRKSLIFSKFHNSAMGGYAGFFRTYKRISGLVYWEGMKKDIQQFVTACDVCQRNKSQTLAQQGCYNFCRFLLIFGPIFLWILL